MLDRKGDYQEHPPSRENDDKKDQKQIQAIQNLGRAVQFRRRGICVSEKVFQQKAPRRLGKP